MSNKRTENLKLLGALFDAEGKGNQLAKEKIDQMISSVIAKIDKVANEGGLMADACAKHGLPMGLFMQPQRLPTSTTPVDRGMLNKCSNGPSPLSETDMKDEYESS